MNDVQGWINSYHLILQVAGYVFSCGSTPGTRIVQSVSRWPGAACMGGGGQLVLVIIMRTVSPTQYSLSVLSSAVGRSSPPHRSFFDGQHQRLGWAVGLLRRLCSLEELNINYTMDYISFKLRP